MNNPELDQLLNRLGNESACFITAWNPLSWSFRSEDNNKANTRLRKELLNHVSEDKIIDGVGVDPTGKWPGEESFLVLGIEEKTATELATVFGQNAYIFYEKDSMAELKLTEHFETD